jgi:hypothetical protein
MTKAWTVALSLVVLTAARHADATTSIFRLGVCCTDNGGTDCTPTGWCTTNDACTTAPYLTCAGGGGADAMMWASGPTYPPDFTSCDPRAPVLTLEASYDAAQHLYRTSQVLLRWDTSSLPDDDVITEATLQVVTTREQCDLANRELTVTADWYDWDEQTRGCDGGDFTAPGVPAFGGLPFDRRGCYHVVNFPIDDVRGINPKGTTYMRVHLDPPDVPSGVNSFDFSAVEGFYYAPSLYVEHRPFRPAPRRR